MAGNVRVSQVNDHGNVGYNVALRQQDLMGEM
jgi:hypothetical protein